MPWPSELQAYIVAPIACKPNLWRPKARQRRLGMSAVWGLWLQVCSFLYGCFYKFGVHVVRSLIIRALLFGVFIRTLIFGNSHVSLENCQDH